MPRVRSILAVALLCACGGGDGPGAPPSDAASEPPADAGAPDDAARADAARAGTPRHDTGADFHLDDPDMEYRPPSRRSRRRQAPADQIHMILRSTPAGALASVDGVLVGRTPAYWEGIADGRPHEVTFVLPGHAMARYRFIPVTDGTVHGRLERLRADPRDAGLPDPGDIPVPGLPAPIDD